MYSDLIADLKSRIDPAYATQLGTESYERRLCVEALEAQAAEIERLRNEKTLGRRLSEAGFTRRKTGKNASGLILETTPDARP